MRRLKNRYLDDIKIFPVARSKERALDNAMPSTKAFNNPAWIIVAA
jgi:hypothetical protein